MLFDGVSVGHPGDVIADGPLQSAPCYPLLDLVALGVNSRMWQRVYFSLARLLTWPLSARGAGLGGIFKSTNSGGSWSHNSPTAVAYGHFDVLALDPSDITPPTTVYAGAGWGGVYRSDDGGATWTEISNALPAFRNIRSIAVHPTNPNIMYVALVGMLLTQTSPTKKFCR